MDLGATTARLSNTILTIDSIEYRYDGVDVPAIADVSLTLERGRIFGLLGPNGAGKSTLISIIVGVRQAQKGKFNCATSSVALVPQDFAFYPQLTCMENLQFFASLHGFNSAQKAQGIERAMDIAQLSSVAKKQAHTLSGGLKRRLNFAIGLVGAPDLLLLDEPTVGVDPQSRAYLLKAVQSLASDGMTIIYTSHYMEEVQAICQDVAIMDAGRILAYDTLDNLLKNAHADLVFDVVDARQIEWNSLPESIKLIAQNNNQLSFKCADQNGAMALHQWLQVQGVQVLGFSAGHADLEQLFLQLTHHRLRD